MQDQYFRAGVGAAIIDDVGRVLAFERADVPGQWQLPQGGLGPDESPEDAVWREIREETGLEASRLRLLGRYPEPLAYELPEQARRPKTGRGQVHYWFFLRLVGVDVELPADGEFVGWRWEPFEQLAEEAVPFRRPIYRRLSAYAAEHFPPRATSTG